jgi:lipopolysaccharide export system protein LptA
LAVLFFDGGRASAQTQAAGQAAQAAPSGLTQNFSANSSKPVDIDAEALEVDDKKKTATFKTKVNVVQGDFKLKADTVVVHYVSTDKSAGGAAKAAPAPAAAAAPGAGGADITTIDATGNVLVTSADGQTISGDRANFDVKKQTVVVEHHVIVTRGKTVLKGSRLIASVADGTYTMDALAKVEGADGPKDPKDRGIRMTFVPAEMKEEADQAKTQAAGKSDGKPDTKAKRKPADASSQAATPKPNGWGAENSGR